ncbi:MAG TPA: 3'(2'),5'-bisphosphate nucleotidase CysQ [Rhizomicrobium sp.]|nr:3'(2'),5'-bisphosphate nucleotidase CysQ [Rhizomicrobium sp.]
MPEADDLALISDAANGAGDIARRFFGGTFKRWNKGKGEPVTEADLAIDQFLRKTLTAARPGYGWLSEESADNEERKAARRTFVVDPIDGTIAFLKSKPHFSHAIAIVEDGRPVAAVVLNPITKECFRAKAGHGATLNGEPAHPSLRHSVEGCRMLAPKALFEHPAWSSAPNVPWPPMHVEQRNSIAYRLGLVGAGIFDAAISLSSKHDWDLAAGDLIVQESGGRMTDHEGKILRYNGPQPIQRSMIAAGPYLHPLLVERTRRLRLPER